MRAPSFALFVGGLLALPVGSGGLVSTGCAVDGCTLSEYVNDPRCGGVPQSDITLLTNRLAKAGGRLHVQIKNLTSGTRVVATLGTAASGAPTFTFTMNSDGSGFADVTATTLTTIPAGAVNITIQAGSKSLSRPLHIYIPASFALTQNATIASSKGQPFQSHIALGHAFYYEEGAGKGFVEEYAVSGTALVGQIARQAFLNIFAGGSVVGMASTAGGTDGVVVSLTSAGSGNYSLDWSALSSFPPYSNLKMLAYTKAWAVGMDRAGTMVAVAGEGSDGPLKLFTLPPMGQSSAALPISGAPSGKQPVALAWGDLDGDGRSDLVALHNADNSLAVYLQKSAQALTYDPNLSQALQQSAGLQSGQPVALAVGDIDQDGLDDVVLTQNPQIFQLANEGDGTFTRVVLIGAAADSIAVGDVTGDNKADLVIAQKATSQLVVYPNQSL